MVIEAVTPYGVVEDPVLQKMRLPEASVVSPNQKQTYISTPYSKINRKIVCVYPPQNFYIITAFRPQEDGG
ncbi:MAG: hypothetical protein J7J03_03720 [Methanosarcinales archaeon]|nr:hypothetical protein [Methanosarcinales archaeon]